MVNYAFLQFSDSGIFFYDFLLLLFGEFVALRFLLVSLKRGFLGVCFGSVAANAGKTDWQE
ncbi:MAG: hypothetical protein AMJ61_06665 [Desulfobacterales bacterium SG8_35_2]|nr:MAG: hypothetical protein AMJ61_06665 [Desulfobacterales bacterium SG8_35_2]